jgi:undecaprenyl-diphosphatase
VDLIKAIILGIIQGLTEFLPVSSTAHLRIIPALLGWQDPGSAFTAVIQLGTLLAVLIYFRQDLGKAISSWAKSHTDKEARKTPEARMGWAVFIGTIPILVLAVLFQKKIEGELRSLQVIACSLIGMGILLAIAEFGAKHKRKLEDVQPRDGLLVGLFQCISLIPGASRSGSTITGGLFAGFNRSAAARFSFLLSVPSVFAAAVFEMVKYRHDFGHDLLIPALVANIFSFIVGYWSIGFLMKFLQTHSVMVFVIYRVVLGVVILVLIARGILDPMAGEKQDPKPRATSAMTRNFQPRLPNFTTPSGIPLRGLRG